MTDAVRPGGSSDGGSQGPSPDHEALVRKHLGGLGIRSLRAIEVGWNSLVFELNGEWIVRVPRRAEVRDWLRREIALLPELQRALPVAVPVLELVQDDAELMFVAYRKLVGARLDDALAAGADAARLGTEIGAFLAALHAFPPARAEALGVDRRDPEALAARTEGFLERCRSEVFPLLDRAERARAGQLFDEFRAQARSFDITLVHADLGPEHILCRGDALAGVIDWSNAQLGDPARDFGWLLHGLDAGLAEALLASYAEQGGSVSGDLPARALHYHRLGPWWEVLYGLEERKQGFVESGLSGIRRRLP